MRLFPVAQGLVLVVVQKVDKEVQYKLTVTMVREVEMAAVSQIHVLNSPVIALLEYKKSEYFL